MGDRAYACARVRAREPVSSPAPVLPLRGVVAVARSVRRRALPNATRGSVRLVLACKRGVGGRTVFRVLARRIHLRSTVRLSTRADARVVDGAPARTRAGSPGQWLTVSGGVV